MRQRPRFRLILESAPSDIPVNVRLRAALKCLLRSYGLRVVEAKQTTATDDARGSTLPSDEVEV